MKKLIPLLLLALATSILASCASSEATTDGSDQRVSTTPWNKPQTWEGQGMLGGMMNK